MGFFEDVWNYLRDAYFNMGKGYENLGVEENPLLSIGSIIFGLYIGIIIACVFIFYNRQIVGSAVRRILGREIYNRESALTISELGYEKNFLIRSFFRDNKSFRRVVKCVEEEDFYAEQNAAREEHERRRKAGESLSRFREETYIINIETDHFYIPAELEIEAITKFNKKGSTWISMIIAIVVVTIAFFAILLFMPWFLELLNKAFGNISGQ